MFRHAFRHVRRYSSKVETEEERRAREQEVAANLLKRFEPQGATMAMVEAALAEGEGSTPAAVKVRGTDPPTQQP